MTECLETYHFSIVKFYKLWYYILVFIAP